MEKAEISSLLNYVKELDEEYERYASRQKPLLGLQIVPGFVLLLKHKALSVKGLVIKEYVSHYDHFILMFPELLSVRAVRFSGETGKVGGDMSLLLEKLQRGREKSGLELEGSFVTMGKLSNVDASSLQVVMPLLLALIRPFSKEGSIFPSPLSLIAHELLGELGKVYLSPCSLTVVLGKFKKKENFPVLGNRLEGFLAYSKALTYKDSLNKVDLVPLKVFIPRNFSEGLSEGSIVHLLGILVFEEGSPVLESQRRGYFLAVQEMPFLPEVEAMAIKGESRCILISAQRKVYEYCYAIESSAEKVNAFIHAISGKISELRRRGAYLAVDELTLGSASREFIEEFTKREGNTYKLLAPPIMALATERESVKIALNEVSEILERLQEVASRRGFETHLKLLGLISIKSSSAREASNTWRVLNMLSGPWRVSFVTQKKYALQYNMDYLI
jgi:hypothetical protein